MNTSFQSKLLAVVLLSALLNGCAPASTPIPPTRTLIPLTITPIPTNTATATPILYNAAIKVIDENGDPVPGAKIIQNETVDFADDQAVWRRSSPSPEFSIDVWAQGYLLQNHSFTLQAGDNEAQVQLIPDPLGLKTAELEKEGYELVFVEDFQDGIVDCEIKGNGNISNDEANFANQLLLVDLRNIEDSFSCFFGPLNIQDAILEVDFFYPEIRYSEFENNDYHWQGYYVEFRDNFNVVGSPLLNPGGPVLQVMDFSTGERISVLAVKQPIQEKRWYQLSANYDGKKLEVRLDGSLKFTFLRPPTMINTKPSHFGAYGQAHIEFDNIKMWIRK